MWPFWTRPPFDIIKCRLGLCWSHVASPSGWSLIRNMGWLGVFLSPLNWMLHKVTPKGKKTIKNKNKKDKTWWTQPMLEPGVNDLESRVLTTGPQHLQLKYTSAIVRSKIHKDNKLSSKVPHCSKKKTSNQLTQDKFCQRNITWTVHVWYTLSAGRQ